VTPAIVGTDAQKTDIALPAPPVQATPGAAAKTVSLDVSDADLQAVVAMLERQSGVKASVVDTGRPYKPVYVHLGDVSLLKAMRTIAVSAGAQVSRNRSGVYVFSPLPGGGRTPPVPAAPSGGGTGVVVP